MNTSILHIRDDVQFKHFLLIFCLNVKRTYGISESTTSVSTDEVSEIGYISELEIVAVEGTAPHLQ